MLTHSPNCSLRPRGRRKVDVVRARTCECIQEVLVSETSQNKVLKSMPIWWDLGTGSGPGEGCKQNITVSWDAHLFGEHVDRTLHHAGN